MIRPVRIACAWVALAVVAGVAHGGAYPWVTLGDDVRVIEDPRIEANLRLELVRRARFSIDIANYDGRVDAAIALPLASALREAADRGVRVRFMASWTSVVVFDYFHKFGRMLVDPPTRQPIEYLVVGGPVAQDQGWGLLDSVHEKLLIVDGRQLLTTGRGLGDQYLVWLDTAFAVRGPLVTQTVDSFERVWREARVTHAPYAVRLGIASSQPPPLHLPTAATALDASQRERLTQTLSWLTPPVAVAPDRLARGRVLHFDFLRQVRAIDPTPATLDVEQRLERLVDPVVQALIDRLATAREVRLTSISSILHPALKQALLQAQRRGARVTLMTNTRAPRLDIARQRIVSGGSLWSLAIDDIDDLLAGGVGVYGFQVNERAPWVYMHRKLAILDDTVIFGSHNFNVPSTAFFDETSFEVVDPTLAAELRRLFDQDLARNGEPLDAAFVHSERLRTGTRILRLLSLPVLGYM
jgi:phosphatidylserine/phosphatidylglycerophosphate/cardiolipin synthase-like enzyme